MITILVFVFLRLLYVCCKISSLTTEPTFFSLTVFVVFALVSFAPGLFLWSWMPPRNSNPFLAPVFVVLTSIGATMAGTWLLYSLRLYSSISSYLLLAFYAVIGLFGIIRLLKRPFSLSSVSLSFSELLVAALSLFFCESVFESVVGHPSLEWDAIVSWDKWAEDISQRTFLGGYIYGAYPQGMPLIIALFYKTLLPSSSSTFLSLPHLLSSGFYSIFPLLLFLSVLAFCRQMKINPLWPFLLIIANRLFVNFIIKMLCYMDIPLSAVVAATFSLVCAESFYKTSKIRIPLFVSYFLHFSLLPLQKGMALFFSLSQLFWHSYSTAVEITGSFSLLYPQPYLQLFSSFTNG